MDHHLCHDRVRSLYCDIHANTRASLDLLQADVVICQLRDVRYDTVVVFDEVLVGLPGWRFGWENAGLEEINPSNQAYES